MMRSATTLTALAFASIASAATFTVNTTTDAVDVAPGNGVCATAAGTCSLRGAVQEANALAGADTITLPAGTFLLSLVGPGEDAAATGDLDVTQPLTVTGAGRTSTVIDGVGQDRVFQATAGNGLTLRALAIRNGNAAGVPGGGVAADAGAALVLEDVAFRANRALAGGGVSVTNAPLAIHGARFEDNITTDAGAAIAHGAGTAALEIDDVVFDGNAAAGDGGGLVYAGTGTVTITASTFTRNSADTAGAALIVMASALTLTDLVVEDCASIGSGDVGGIYANGVGTATMQNLTLRRNATNGTAGGMAAVTTGNLTVNGCTVEDNLAGESAGGIYFATSAGGLDVDGCVVRGNRALSQAAGGLRLQVAGATTMRNLVVEDNAGVAGGGIAAMLNGPLTLTGSRIAGNTSGSGPGGGIYVTANGAVVVRDTTVQGNQATVNSGGAILVSPQPITVDGSTFADNLVFGVGASGGGLVVSAGATTITNSTFSGNWAQGAGGGFAAAATVAIANSTFYGNTAGGPGSAIVVLGGMVTVRSTAIAATDVPSCAAALGSAGDNVDQDGSCLLAGPRDRSAIDPMLGPLKDNGGPTFTHEPLPASPLVDGVGGGDCPATDQRGVARPTDGNGDGTAACDVGAVEFVDECPADPDKTLPGVCGCGVPDADANANGAIDCLLNAELKARIASARTVMLSLTGVKSDAETAAKAQLTELADGLLSFVTANDAAIVKTDPSAKLAKLAKKARKALRATRKGKGGALQKKQTRAGKALDTLDAVVAP